MHGIRPDGLVWIFCIPKNREESILFPQTRRRVRREEDQDPRTHPWSHSFHPFIPSHPIHLRFLPSKPRSHTEHILFLTKERRGALKPEILPQDRSRWTVSCCPCRASLFFVS